MKHILFLTWKDIKHPRAGWAERVIFEYAVRLVQDGHRVTWFGSSFDGAVESEIIEWIRIIRKYSINTIYFLAWKWYKEFKKNNPVDIIIDEAGGIPLISPLYEKHIPIYFFIHHIGDHEYKTAFPFPLNWMFIRFVFWTFSLYKHIPTITVSNSTANELREQHWFTNISVVENATHLVPINAINWENKQKEIVFYGRLTPMKRADHAIRAFQILAQTDSEYHMNVIWNPQDQEYTNELNLLVAELWIAHRVHFLWFSHDLVTKYLPRAQVMLVPSTKEWYGLIVLEWNSFGLPIIAYNVPWLRDSVRDWKNWILVSDWDYEAMWSKLVVLTSDRHALITISESSLAFIKKFGWWDERYKEFKKIIKI